MFRSIRTVIGGIVFFAIIVSTVSVLWLALNEHEKLYLESQQNNMFALSRNVSSDLVPVLEQQPIDTLAISLILLRLEPYDSVIFAEVFDDEGNKIEDYIGLSGRKLPKDIDGFHKSPNDYPLGISIEKGKLISLERIGDQSFPLGYVLIVNDLQTPIANSRFSLIIQSAPWVFLTLVISSLIFILLISRAFRPLLFLSQFAQRVTDTKDYSLRFPVKGANEVSKLGRTINRLMATIEDELIINQEQNKTLLEQQQTMAHLANFDSLTGLPNRQFVMDNLKVELARAKRIDSDLVLMFFDLDGFKGINDSLGHDMGDLILIEVAQRVKTLLRDSDLIARLGGDEFLVLPDRDTSQASIENMSARIIAAFSEPFFLKGLALKIGVSLGVAKASDANYDLSQLISNADLAMYRSKANGRGICTVFNQEMSESHKRKITLANTIDNGLAENQFKVVYQAKVDKYGNIVGFESLIRWSHPTMGMIMPSEFIPIAEQGGKIGHITYWIINQVCTEINDVIALFGNKIRVGVNLSVHDLQNSELFDYIYNVFTQHDINPENLEFEVTESAYLDNFVSSNKFFKRISNMGCAIALDDFGTGYSSLSYLTQISVDTLKIDRQFISELETSEASRLVTGSIIDLAKRLSLKICAEGIENKAQWDYLNEQGCDTMQGYLFSKPIALDKLASLPMRFERVLDPQAD